MNTQHFEYLARNSKVYDLEPNSINKNHLYLHPIKGSYTLDQLIYFENIGTDKLPLVIVNKPRKLYGQISHELAIWENRFIDTHGFLPF